MPRVLIKNLDKSDVVKKAGELLKEWALDDGTDDSKTHWWDMTPEQRLDALKATGLEFEGSVKRISIFQSDEATLKLTLPPAECLRVALDEIATNPRGYRITDIYVDFVKNPTKYDESHELLPFYDFRIGDYILQHCM